ncbi:VUT family protein [Cohnella sp. REN36]|uniref:VUT family protein n=1 Tax=Cohnella sp. REN36 TaxID=2887347 RepID=UPI001D1530FE|nr:VUT family protein [Cohnella sp. REN36]MCC3371738.1 VUT family protein [Cohnella sp. REN36]
MKLPRSASISSVLVLSYLTAIILANVLTASLAPIAAGSLLIPAGSFLIGATFILRDLVQQAIGRRHSYLAIAAAMILSAVSSLALGDSIWITVASAATFLFSESADTEVYTRLRLPLAQRVLYSGLAGGVIDSAIFVVIGLSPLGAGVLPWALVGPAIGGQVLVKTLLQVAGAAVIHELAKRRRLPNGGLERSH